MRLSQCGLNKILDEIEATEAMGGELDFEGIEFEAEDFEGVICLTVEEAKRLHNCAMFFWSDYEGTKYFTNDDKRFLTDMKERIEQAEGKCSSE